MKRLYEENTLKEKELPKRFKPNLKKGQTVLLIERDLKIPDEGDKKKMVENKYVVKEIYRNFVCFERVNQHGIVIKASYTWHDLRKVLKSKRISCNVS